MVLLSVRGVRVDADTVMESIVLLVMVIVAFLIVTLLTFGHELICPICRRERKR